MDIDDYKTDLVASLTEAWELARRSVKEAQQKQKKYYDHRSKTPRFRVGDRVLVYMPSAKQGKAWKFARTVHGPFRILELTSSNASVRPVDKPQELPIFVSVTALENYQRARHGLVVRPGKDNLGDGVHPLLLQIPNVMAKTGPDACVPGIKDEDAYDLTRGRCNEQ